jgi:lauroyl/myristoyl acyltransferase
VTTTVGDRILEIREGAARLAVETGAVLIAGFAHIQSNGQILLHFEPPIEASTGEPNAQIEAMTQRFAQIYSQQWSRQYAGMQWGFLAMYLGLPIK